MLRANYARYILEFKSPARTSREVMSQKETFFIKVWDDDSPEVFGLGECALFRGLSCDDRSDYEAKLRAVCESPDLFGKEELSDFPSILFGLETAMLDLRNGGHRIVFPGNWSAGLSEIQINGLVWMGSIEEMSCRLAEKTAAGFRCVKFKVGGADFDQELALLERIRAEYSPDLLEIRIDANGAFSADEALGKIERLSKLEIHSIEQPIRQGQIERMREICRCSPIPVALDEELIGINDPEEKYKLLSAVKPAYIILKPALCGGFSGASEWISVGELLDVGWWVTSALESNVGLNAIAQWVSGYSPAMPQGLGTGQLYVNNIASPVFQTGEVLKYDINKHWIIPELSWQ
ncbi:MAG: o-succinylbenzoate synthase [Paramuribaculum sp.]|nr:o-succinylbenzoate synthase [Paramuribaculum sp.]